MFQSHQSFKNKEKVNKQKLRESIDKSLKGATPMRCHD